MKIAEVRAVWRAGWRRGPVPVTLGLLVGAIGLYTALWWSNDLKWERWYADAEVCDESSGSARAIGSCIERVDAVVTAKSDEGGVRLDVRDPEFPDDVYEPVRFKDDGPVSSAVSVGDTVRLQSWIGDVQHVEARGKHQDTADTVKHGALRWVLGGVLVALCGALLVWRGIRSASRR
ncbi:hypothetical protein [Streptomyces sp. NPDC048442]|uniref:hypothetical protein n=1 Tax=Streptomyces sp. NPDC048442 TaxID=3154823 RepID=UPI00343F9EB9